LKIKVGGLEGGQTVFWPQNYLITLNINPNMH
jgi:hypothetical protein